MDRNEFAKRLNEIIIPEGSSTETINASMRSISKAIFQMMPDSLFRFRPCSDNSIGAFKEGNIYAFTADKFNDPYDTLPRYDIVEIEKGVNAMMNRSALEELKDWLQRGNDYPDYIKQVLPSEITDLLRNSLLAVDDLTPMEDYLEKCRQNMISLIETMFPVISETSKRFTTIACFCENVHQILMWSHYADSHKGFALEYQFRATFEHPLKNICLYPVIYGEERIDVSAFIAWAFLSTFGIKSKNPDITASIKTALNKSDIWAYEKEWRLLDLTPRDIFAQDNTVIPYEPVAIYYGRHISQENKQLLHSIAQEKGIKEFEMYVDYSSPLYEMQYRPAFT